jgi:hypothetical protein
MINEEACLMPSLKESKHFMPWFDALFIRGQELWFGTCNRYVKADPDTINLSTYDSYTFDSMPKKDTLCFFDKESHRWAMILSKHCRVSWQVNTADDDIYLLMLASIAEDEIKGSRGDRNDFAITNRIKNRYSTWFEERNIKKRNDKLWEKRTCPSVKHTAPPQPKFVQFNGDYTTVVWKDGSHTVVKRSEGEEYDEEKAILFAIVKHLCNDNGCEMSRYFDKFFKNERNINKED